jgi:hypothetical protein
MISSHDRAGWFGASDTARIMGGWDTKTFGLWWMEKLGLRQSNIRTLPMIAGTHYEHRILDHLGIARRDRQVKIRKLRLRVNLDGEDARTVYEVKTYGYDGVFRVTKAYWQQCQVEMYATGKRCEIVAYRLKEEDYKNFFNPIDPARITRHEIEQDRVWVRDEYLPRLRYLKHCMRKGVTPNAVSFRQSQTG